MKPRVFLDTNILVYADDLDAGSRNEVARGLLHKHISDQTAVVSTQVLQEFLVTATRKLGIEASVARRKVELLATLDVIRVQPDDILAAIDLHRLHSFSFWDALVVRCAHVAGCTRLLTEDLQHGCRIDGLLVENPFQ